VKRFVFFISLVGLSAPLYSASVLDIGTDYRIRGISVANPGYGAPNDQNRAYYSQRLLAHVGGRFSPNIEFMTQFQALGVAGSSGTVIDPVANQAVIRPPNEVAGQYAPVQHYAHTDFTPFMQWAYFKANELHDWPLDLTIGRQPIVWGDGLILSDDDLGFTGFRAQARLPWYDLQSDLFTFKVMDQIAGTSDSDLYGVQLTKPMKNIRVQLSFVNEHDSSGSTLYIRPTENAAAIQARTPATPINWQASSITRSFYDARVEGRLLEGGFYKGEFALQNGSVHRDPTVPGGSVNLSGYGMLLSGGLYTRFSKYGPIEVHGLFGLGSGDSGDAGKDSSFHPTYGHRVDGLERSGFGELFGASLYDANASSANPNGLPAGASGIRIFGGGVTTHPTSLLSIGIDYFAYDAMEQANSTFQSSAQGSGLGSEIDIGAGFAYTNYLTFRASAAFFSPGSAFVNGRQAHRYLIEARGRF
jgi:hypothetical protein